MRRAVAGRYNGGMPTVAHPTPPRRTTFAFASMLAVLATGCEGEPAEPDLLASPDLAIPPDLGSPARDLGPPPDLASPPDLAPRPQRFAVIGDYGGDCPDELKVSDMIKSWDPDFIVTTGDNNYPNGDRATIDANIGKYFSDFIGNYMGKYGPGSPVNRFFPSVGNHDWYGTEKLQPYIDYFAGLPGNRRYYDVDLGRVHLFAVNSEGPVEPDGTTPGSVQYEWLKARLAASRACFKIVYFHVPPRSSGPFHDPNLDWPFHDWGADVVINGHEHVYERIDRGGRLYLINGLGGVENRFGFPTPLPDSVFRYSDEFGAQRGVAAIDGLTLEFWAASGKLIDSVTIPRHCPM